MGLVDSILEWFRPGLEVDQEIKDQKTIEEYFNHGHFDVIMPDGTRDDYDNGIADFYARGNNLGECLDRNDSEAFLHRIDDSCITVHYFVYGRKYEKTSWEEKQFETTGKLVMDEDQEPVYKIDRLDEIVNSPYARLEELHELSSEEKQRIEDITDLQKRNYKELVKLFPDIDFDDYFSDEIKVK